MDPSETRAYRSSVALHPPSTPRCLVFIGCVHTRCVYSGMSQGDPSIKKGQQRSGEKECSLGGAGSAGLGDAGEVEF